MKKFLKTIGVLFILLIIIMIILPFIFKDEIKEVVINATNNSLNAQVDFSDIDLSLFKSFPNLAIGIEDLTVINKAPFEGDTVISVNSVNFSVDLISAISGEVLKVNSVNLESPKMILYTLGDGRANYNIAKEDSISSEVPAQDTSQSNFNIELKSYKITNGKIAYIDQMSNLMFAINNLNHSGSGDFSQDDFILDTETSIDELTLEMDGIKYLNQVKTMLDMQLGINLPNMKFTLKDNQLTLNNLILNFDGSIELPEEHIALDLSFSSPRSDFKDIISLIPAIYQNDFSDIESSGKMQFDGMIKGKMTENKLPAFTTNLKVEKGNFKYPDLPTQIENVNLVLNVKNSDGLVENTIIDLSKIHLEIGNDPIDGKLKLTNLETGPNIETNIKGKINLENLKKALDLKDIAKLEGTLISNFEAKGNISTASSNYEQINAKGNINLENVIYQSEVDGEEINISNAELNFTPKHVQLNKFTAKMGESDISASGKLNNLISYIISDGTLYGQLNLNSNYFNFNPYLTSTEGETVESDEESAETTAFDVPKNINFTLQSSFKKLLYDNLELKNVTGKIVVRDNKISLNNLNMNLLQGSLSGNGYYAKSEYQENPDILFNLKIDDFNIKQTYDKFLSVKQFAPIAKYIDGNFSSSLSMNTSLDNTLTPKWETFFSEGLLNLKTVEIINFKPFTTVGSLLSLQELSNPKLAGVNPKFEIKNGRFFLNPVEYKVGQYNVVLSGSNGLDQSLDYVMEIDVPAEKVKSQANKAIGSLIGKDISLIKSNTVKVKALIGGTVDSPKVKTSAADVATDVVSQVKDAVVAEATAQADSLQAAAEAKLKAEAKKKEEEMKKKLEEEAKKKLKKLFGFG